MCVILVVDRERPTEEEIEACWATNPDGGGVAWREGEKKAQRIHWKKGLNLDAMKEQLLEKLPLPYIAHFRVASIGGVYRVLTHPFVISHNAESSLEGFTDKPVLFHNGHWATYDTAVINTAFHGRLTIPRGRWNDSRGMAWLASYHGMGFLDLLDGQRFAIISPNQPLEILGKDWYFHVHHLEKEKVDDRGFLCSNDHWIGRLRSGWRRADKRLPAAYQDKSSSKEEDTTDEKATQIILRGGSLDSVPFETIEALYISKRLGADGRPIVSKKMFKRRKKLHDRRLKKIEEAAERRKVREDAARAMEQAEEQLKNDPTIVH